LQRRAEAAKKKLATAQAGVAEWTAVVSKLEERERECTKAIHELHAAGVVLPPPVRP
jgi:hypothetical protein